MLSNKQLEYNKQKFIETNLKYKIFNSELEIFLGEDFYVAPATTNSDMYGAYPGGLLHHLIKSCAYSINVNNLLPEKNRVDINTIVRTIFLSQIGKVFMFKLNTNDWEVKNRKQIYTFNENEFYFKNGEKSLFYIMKYGVNISENEYHAILSLDKIEDDKNIKFTPTTLLQIIRVGFTLAIIEEKNG